MKKVQKNWIDELSTRGVEEGLSIVRGQQDTIKVREFGGKGAQDGRLNQSDDFLRITLLPFPLGPHT
jgi:hypothetical protein